MKTIFTSLFLVLTISVWSQTRTQQVKQSPSTESKPTDVSGGNQRTASSSAKTDTHAPAPLPYDVNDKYMGRSSEILNTIILSQIPADFPIYEKQWSVQDYNAVVDAYYANHLEILKDQYREKINAIKNR